MFDTEIQMAIDMSNIIKRAAEPNPLWQRLQSLEFAKAVCAELKGFICIWL